MDTSVEGEQSDDHPLMLREAAKSKITNQRDRIESKLAQGAVRAERWLRVAGGGWFAAELSR